MQTQRPFPLIKVVGISASGKSTLVRALREAGYNARPISQEHSAVATLWAQFERPALLIFLDASLACQRRRRPDVAWTRSWHATELDRLHNARSHADLLIDTSFMSAEEVLRLVLLFLQHEGVRHAGEPLPPVADTGTGAGQRFVIRLFRFGSDDSLQIYLPNRLRHVFAPLRTEGFWD